MNDQNWKNEYKRMKVLEPFQIKLLDEGANTLSQAWLLNQMWSDWYENKANSGDKDSLVSRNTLDWTNDPWDID